MLPDDDRFAGRIKVLGLHGMSKDAWSRFSDEGYKHYQVIHAGYKYNMMDIQAAMGIHQPPNTRHAYHLYTPLIDIDKLDKNRDWVLNALTAENIGVGVHYLPVHLHPFYRKTFGWKEGDFPNAEWIGERTLSLPLSAALDEKDVGDVVEAVHKVVKI